MTKWTPPIEALVRSIGEQSECYAILHRNAEKYYAYLTHFFAIPAIVLSTVAGTGSFAFGGDGSKETSSMVGAISIAVGVIQTLATYYRFAQLSETHRVSAISYQKMYNRISGELVLERTDRADAEQFLATLRADIERLEEVAPNIPDKVITAFKRKYSDSPEVKRPTVANGLEKIEVNTDVPVHVVSPVPEVHLGEVPPEPVPEVLPEVPSTSTAPPKSKVWR